MWDGLAAMVVHTTGVNIDGFIANVGALSVVIALAVRIATWSVTRAMEQTVEHVIAKKVDPVISRLENQSLQHDRDLASLKGYREGRSDELLNLRALRRTADEEEGR